MVFHSTVPTSDLVDDKVHLAICAFAELPDDLIVFIDVQLLQVLGCDELQLIQDINRGTGHVRGGAHYSRRAGPVTTRKT